MPLATRRWLCGSSSSAARATVLRLAEQQPGGELSDDLQRKFNLLTACEREFGLPMPHSALNEVGTVEHAAQWWEERIAAEEKRRAEEEQHFTNNAPPNLLLLDRRSEDYKDFLSRARGRGSGDADGDGGLPPGDIPF